MDSRRTKDCPYCGETILAVAIRCKHCHADLTASLSPPSETAEAGVVDHPDQLEPMPEVGTVESSNASLGPKRRSPWPAIVFGGILVAGLAFALWPQIRQQPSAAASVQTLANATGLRGSSTLSEATKQQIYDLCVKTHEVNIKGQIFQMPQRNLWWKPAYDPKNITVQPDGSVKIYEEYTEIGRVGMICTARYVTPEQRWTAGYGYENGDGVTFGGSAGQSTNVSQVNTPAPADLVENTPLHNALSGIENHLKVASEPSYQERRGYMAEQYDSIYRIWNKAVVKDHLATDEQMEKYTGLQLCEVARQAYYAASDARDSVLADKMHGELELRKCTYVPR